MPQLLADLEHEFWFPWHPVRMDAPDEQHERDL